MQWLDNSFIEFYLYQKLPKIISVKKSVPKSQNDPKVKIAKNGHYVELAKQWQSNVSPKTPTRGKSPRAPIEQFFMFLSKITIVKNKYKLIYKCLRFFKFDALFV